MTHSAPKAWGVCSSWEAANSPKGGFAPVGAAQHLRPPLCRAANWGGASGEGGNGHFWEGTHPTHAPEVFLHVMVWCSPVRGFLRGSPVAPDQAFCRAGGGVPQHPPRWREQDTAPVPRHANLQLVPLTQHRDLQPPARPCRSSHRSQQTAALPVAPCCPRRCCCSPGGLKSQITVRSDINLP